MNFSRPFIRRPIGTTLLAVGLFLVGAVAYSFLPVASLPSIDFPTINVSANRPGAEPNIMAATVAAPLERRLAARHGTQRRAGQQHPGDPQPGRLRGVEGRLTMPSFCIPGVSNPL